MKCSRAWSHCSQAVHISFSEFRTILCSFVRDPLLYETQLVACLRVDKHVFERSRLETVFDQLAYRIAKVRNDESTFLVAHTVRRKAHNDAWDPC
jgi:hypothetical protein